MILFMIFSCIIRQLDYIWHGFHFTNMIPYRFAYLITFIVVVMAFRAFMNIDKISVIGAIVASLLTFFTLAMAIGDEKFANMFKDFAVEYDGKTTRLSDYVGRGKYVLVDFWASWCGPCRQEIPNLISLYEKYKDKEFLVLGVAVQDNPEASLKAIDEMQIPYPQILNTQKIATNLYGIDIIPETILFAPDGTILARGLHGEEIEQQLQKTFNNK